MLLEFMKILFWFNGSGGQRRERKIKDYPKISEFDIENDLEDWKDSLNSNSEFQRWGWTENFNPITKEPIT